MMKHISVLLNESISSLNLKENSIIVDATLGYGGHSSNILERIDKGYLFAFDQDSEAIRYSTDRLRHIGTNFTIIKSNFVNMKAELEKFGIEKVDGVLFDLGVSSPQLDDKSRGFSFHEDARLDMRMNKEQKLSAYEVVNEYSEKDLANIFFKYGEDKFSKNVARKIVQYRKIKKIETTLELVNIIENSIPRSRVAVITFHALEDRIVKKNLKKITEIDDKVKGIPNIPDEYLPDFKLITNKAITPNDEELETNPRSRSSKLRVIERIK